MTPALQVFGFEMAAAWDRIRPWLAGERSGNGPTRGDGTCRFQRGR